MKTFFSKHLNRETEQIMLDIIGDFCSSPGDNNTILRLRIHIKKRRDIGMIYIERVLRDVVIKRRYFINAMWEPVRCMYAVWGSTFLRKAMHELAYTNLCTSKLRDMITDCERSYHDIRLCMP